MALHENYREYTSDELKAIKKEVCEKHKCPYMKVVHDNGMNPKFSVKHSCDYILYTGKSRGCMPDECEHWKDENVGKKPKY